MLYIYVNIYLTSGKGLWFADMYDEKFKFCIDQNMELLFSETQNGEVFFV